MSDVLIGIVLVLLFTASLLAVVPVLSAIAVKYIFPLYDYYDKYIQWVFDKLGA